MSSNRLPRKAKTRVPIITLPHSSWAFGQAPSALSLNKLGGSLAPTSHNLLICHQGL